MLSELRQVMGDLDSLDTRPSHLAPLPLDTRPSTLVSILKSFG